MYKRWRVGKAKSLERRQWGTWNGFTVVLTKRVLVSHETKSAVEKFQDGK